MGVPGSLGITEYHLLYKCCFVSVASPGGEIEKTSLRTLFCPSVQGQWLLVYSVTLMYLQSLYQILSPREISIKF